MATDFETKLRERSKAAIATLPPPEQPDDPLRMTVRPPLAVWQKVFQAMDKAAKENPDSVGDKFRKVMDHLKTVCGANSDSKEVVPITGSFDGFKLMSDCCKLMSEPVWRDIWKFHDKEQYEPEPKVEKPDQDLSALVAETKLRTDLDEPARGVEKPVADVAEDTRPTLF